MSYSIIYGQQFIKAIKGDKTFYLPIVLIGDNNVYDYNNKRARDFNNLANYCGGKQYATKEALLEAVDNTRLSLMERYDGTDGDKYDDRGFGYYDSLSLYGKSTRATTFQNFKNVFNNGIKNALTIEELVSAGVYPEIYTSVYSASKLIELGLNTITLSPKTTLELLDMIDSTESYLSGSGCNFYVTFRGDDNTLKYLKNKFNPTAPKGKRQLKEVKKYYILLTRENTYIHKMTGRRLFSSDFNAAKKFMTNGQAQKMMDKIHLRFPMRSLTIEETILIIPILI